MSRKSKEDNLRYYLRDKSVLENTILELQDDKSHLESNQLIQEYLDLCENLNERKSALNALEDSCPRLLYIDQSADENGKIDEEMIAYDNVYGDCIICGQSHSFDGEEYAIIIHKNSDSTLILNGIYEIVKSTFFKLIKKGFTYDTARIHTQNIIQQIVSEMEIDNFHKEDNSKILKLVSTKIDLI